MGWFKKRGDFIDLTEMQKKGLIDRAREKDRFGEKENEVVDLGSFARTESSNVVGSSAEGVSSPASSFGFLDNLANAGNSVGSSENETSSYSDKLRELRKPKIEELNQMKTKMDDLEFKLERLMEKIELIESKILSDG